MDFLTHPVRLTILSRRETPALDAPQSVWDEAMTFFSADERAFIANAAAHFYTVLEEEEGIISLIWFDDNNPTRNVGTLLYRYGPDISHSYTLEGDALTLRINAIKAQERALLT